MKTSKLIALAMVALTLSFTPAMAQRGGGGGRSGGGHSSSSMSRSSSSSSSSSRSSFSGSSSRSSSSYSSPSRSSSSSSRSSYSSPSRSTSSSVRSSSSPSRSSYGERSRGTSAPTRSSVGERSRGTSGVPSRSSYSDSPRSRSTVTRGSDHREPMTRTGVGTSSRGEGSGAGVRTRGGNTTATRSGVTASHGGPTVNGRPNSNPGARSAGYARPGRPGPLPPSSRPIHPAPYFYHPWHGYVVHCHPVFWDPFPPRPWYWPGFWHYCNSYWYDYHVTDVVVVHDYVQQTYNVDMITYGISGDIMYAIVRDGGETYLQVYDKDDHLIAEQKINKKYCNLVIDAESGGCWISKKHDKDPLLFLWSDGQLLIYEAD